MTRKIFFAAILIFLSASISFGAVSDDHEIYLRRDVFEAKMDAFMAEIRLMNEQLYNKLHGEIEDVRKEVNDVRNELIKTRAELSERINVLSGRIDALNGRIDALNGRIDGLEYKIDVLETVVYWGLGLLTLAITLAGVVPVLAKLFKDLRTPSITFDDIRRFIEENYPNMSINGQTQVSNVNPLR